MSIRRSAIPSPASGTAQIINLGPIGTFGVDFAQFDLIAPTSPPSESAGLELDFLTPQRSFGFDASYTRDPSRSRVEWRFFAGDSVVGRVQRPEGMAFTGVTLGVPATRGEVHALRASAFDSTHAPYFLDNIEGRTVPGPAGTAALAWIAIASFRRMRTR